MSDLMDEYLRQKESLMEPDRDIMGSLIEQLQQRNTELEKLTKSQRKLEAQLQGEINHLEVKNNELAASVERLRDAIDRSGLSKTSQELSDLLRLTPQDNLNHVKREALIELAKHMTPEQGISHLYGGGDVRDYAHAKYPSDKDSQS